ncbi:MAG: aminopeptidase P family protein [Desulfobacterales bacterium]|nr:MAG: aminopeptidase P family protein [Desulfobacterales bacterium]
MFPASTYIARRRRLKEDLKSGIILFLGNERSPMNFPDNEYVFRQDSSFLYFWGIDLPGLAAIIDIEQDKEVVFGRELTIEDIIWSGARTPLKEHCLNCGVNVTAALAQLEATIYEAVQKGRRVHFLPQYRPENFIKIQNLLGLNVAVANYHTSPTLIKAVVAQRSVKTEEEIQQIETALEVTHDMQTLAMKMSQPGMREKEIVGAMLGRAYARVGNGLAYPIIFTTKGHILHNPNHGNVMRAGDLVINDSGCESDLHYASDITRTFPVGAKFTRQQREIYSIVLQAQQKAIENIRAGIEYREVHFIAAREVAMGLKTLGLMSGDVDDAVAAGAHALFFPHGLGHMLGLDVHDMEDLGEDYVGYTDAIQRNPQFGICYLRLAKKLEPGFVLTVEPGLYFIPDLIDQWKTEKRCEAFINYAKVEAYRNFGGIRIEDNVLALEDGQRVLGRPIPKRVEELEALVGQ